VDPPQDELVKLNIGGSCDDFGEGLHYLVFIMVWCWSSPTLFRNFDSLH